MKYRAAIVCLIGSLLFCAAENLSAQQGQGRGPGFGGRQFGGGFLAGLLRIEAVQKELNLTDSQLQEAQQAMQALRQAQSQEAPGDRPNFADMSDEERAQAFARMRERNQQRLKASKEALAKVLSAEQMSRLTQIYLQQQGTRALSEPDVAASLQLTPEQQTKIAGVLNEFGQGARPGGGAGQGQVDRAALRERMRERRAQLDKDVMAILTAEQQAKLKDLQGTPLELPEGAFFGRGGGQGGNRGGSTN